VTPQQSSKHPKHYASKFKVYPANIQAVPTGVLTRIEMGSGVIFDTLNEIDVALFQFQPQRAGYYFFYAATAFQALNVGDETEVHLYRNLVDERAARKAQTLVGDTPAQLSCILRLVPTDVVYVMGWHNFGANRNVFNGVSLSCFEGFRVG